MPNKKRTETDSLGTKKIDSHRLWGAQTQRSLENFKISNNIMPTEIVKALGLQKKACVLANHSLGLINKRLSNAISKACDNVINLNLIDEFPLSVWQTGSGTQTNMNANEVISNYAIKILKGRVGSKYPVHPNDHVNLSQSSNDTFPTIMHIAVNELTDSKLIPSIKKLISELRKKTKSYSKTIKIGRTHTQDATPLTMGDEFSGYLHQIENNLERIKLSKKESCSLLAKESLEESLLFLRNIYGSDINAWRWGESNTLRHSSFSSPNILIPRFLRDISHEMPGGRFTLNSSWSENNGEISEKPKASGFRMIIDFSEPDKSMFIISTGQSGHFLSKNYDNLTNLWKQGDYITISTNIPIILGGSKGKVIISPSLIK